MSELREQQDVSESDALFIAEFIKARRWKNSKTYEDKAPHEYTVKAWMLENQPDFVKFIKLIHANGFQRKYFRSTWTYYLYDGWEYFTHNDKSPDYLPVINRARPPVGIKGIEDNASFWKE